MGIGFTGFGTGGGLQGVRILPPAAVEAKFPSFVFPSTDLYVKYTMDNVSGSTLVDEQGNYNLTITGGPSVVSGHDGNAYDFDGSAQAEHMADTGTDTNFNCADINFQGTMAAWVKVGNVVNIIASTRRAVATNSWINFRMSGAGSVQWKHGYTDSSPFFEIWTSTIQIDNPNIYNFVAVSVDDVNNEIIFSINGTNETISASYNAGSNVMPLESKRLELGRYKAHTFFTEWYTGEIDTFMYWTRALTGDELIAAYNTT